VRPVLLSILLAAFLSGCVSDDVGTRRPGQQLVCHAGTTLSVSNADSFVHLDHGDGIGPCPKP